MSWVMVTFGFPNNGYFGKVEPSTNMRPGIMLSVGGTGAMSKSLRARGNVLAACRPEGVGRGGREERSGSILEVKRGTERLLAHGFFRRTGGTGSVNRRKRTPQRSLLDLRAACDRSEPDLHSLGLPSPEAALTSRTGPLPTPQSRRLASAPPAGQDRCNIVQIRTEVKNRVRTSLSARCRRSLRRRSSSPGLSRGSTSLEALRLSRRGWPGQARP